MIHIDNQVLSILSKKIETIKVDIGYIYLIGPIMLPLEVDGKKEMFNWYSWLHCELLYSHIELIESLPNKKLAHLQQSSILTFGDFSNSETALLRLHSICHTGDIFGSSRCDCGFQFQMSLRMIVENKSGALVYLSNHEGRGIGLFSKALAYLLQDGGFDTVEANNLLGFSDDLRDYSEAIQIIKSLRKKSISLITNNPLKLEPFRKYGLNIKERIPLWGGLSEYNEDYILKKINKSGHIPFIKL
ncbi:GTP cyclohydrolase II [Lysinibacillus alkalisoli]|uniref:GTP cyclohydrolase II n=1 Tax=Lysinibacillus alkalisoli TaxID=1911548 RepID=A0A917GAI4_9BACI|nr:GTP cyclohydrolase II [Lysinibacillus alkalisoli]